MRTPQGVTRWIDTHIHVSDRGEGGAVRARLIEDPLAVLDAAGTDLRLVISPDGHWNAIVRDEPDGAHRANTFIHSLVQRAPDRLYGSCIVNPSVPDAKYILAHLVGLPEDNPPIVDTYLDILGNKTIVLPHVLRQELIVDIALHGTFDEWAALVSTDPLRARLTFGQARAMLREMIEAHRAWARNPRLLQQA